MLDPAASRSRALPRQESGASAATALVTGGSSGIGRELALRLGRSGWDVVLVARHDAALEEARRELAAAVQTRLVALPYDLAEPGAPDRLFDALESRGVAIDVLVNCAGLGDYGPFARAAWEKQLAMLQLNVVALTQLTKRSLPGMLARGRGRILNVASTTAFRPGPLMAVYSATKAYVLSFSEALASELQGTGVTVTALCPGPTRTGFHAAAGLEAVRRRREPRLAAPGDVAAFGYEALMRRRTVAVHGLGNRVGISVLRLLPRGLQTDLVRRARQRTRGEARRS